VWVEWRRERGVRYTRGGLRNSNAMHFKWAAARLSPGAGDGVFSEVGGGWDLLGGLGLGAGGGGGGCTRGSAIAEDAGGPGCGAQAQGEAGRRRPPHFTPAPCEGHCSKGSGTCTCIALGVVLREVLRVLPGLLRPLPGLQVHREVCPWRAPSVYPLFAPGVPLI